ncbi:RsmB/NOP family class I SAM-dependent RNA methyltransferase [Williamsia sp. CHRR-6]|uniref:RsmB/NOP family class I SAM-dependent RNA methyltransferase n=1 Tax=Williamsia sp. CHRR-6 TaxID=2835871 RepID=UPI001BD9A524|nr:transcription antitermination factor NusB [Williamsia sp. CHRR-6]MBT0568023.1 rRNA small subunit methyltransferase B [Williamsia sp. CHRR-6]
MNRRADTSGGRERAAGNRPAHLRDKAVDPVRATTRDVLRAVRERDAYANLVLPKLLTERKITGRDAALATELTYGTCRALGVLDEVIAAASGRPVAEIDGPVLDVLRMGAYQLLRTRIGAHAAVSTSVDLIRSEAGQGPAGFCNAVLRKISQRDDELWTEALAPPMAQDMVGYLAFRYAHPRWIAQVFADALGGGAGELAAALAADDARPLVHLAARPGLITAEELASATGGEVGRFSPYCVYLSAGDPGSLDAVRDGLAGVQDEGSQLVARALAQAQLEGPDTGRWVDLCAGPGGKAALLGAVAELDGAHLDAVEPSEHRAELVRQACAGLPVTVHVADGRDSRLTPGYDRVLVDAPCTGLGSLRRRPEARWRRQPSDVPELVALQRQLLRAAIEMTRPGGVVVYSTCSPHPAETVGVVESVVAEMDSVQIIDARPLVPVPDLPDSPYVQLWPHRHGTDAMFLAAVTIVEHGTE